MACGENYFSFRCEKCGNLYRSHLTCKRRTCQKCARVRSFQMVEMYLPVVSCFQWACLLTLTLKVVPNGNVQSEVDRIIASKSQFTKVKLVNMSEYQILEYRDIKCVVAGILELIKACNNNEIRDELTNYIAKKRSKIYIIEFTQNDCSPCELQKGDFLKLEREFKSKIEFYLVNIDINDNKEFFKSMDFTITPTTILIKDLMPDFIIGYKNFEYYLEKIQDNDQICINCDKKGAIRGDKVECKLHGGIMYKSDSCEMFH